MSLHPLFAKRFAERALRQVPPRHQGTVEEARAQMAEDRRALGQGPEVGAIQELQILTRAGQISARLYQPLEPARATILYLHGGGWILGTLDDYAALARALAARSRCNVLLLDYRLAPEHPFPAALEDAEDALLWMMGRCKTPLILVGDSAGANLAAVVANRLHDKVGIALQLLLYPVTDFDMQTSSYGAYGKDHALDLLDMRWYLNHYARTQDWHDPRISPLRTADLSGLPPTWIALAECDVLRDEGAAYGHRLAAAGVVVSVCEYAGMAHGFAPMFNILDVADKLLTDIAQQIAETLPPDSSHHHSS
jgi:acetyl esterase